MFRSSATLTEILFKNLKNTVPAYDQISAVVVKTVCDIIAVQLASLVNALIEEGIIPSSLKLSRNVQILKR